MGIQYPWEATPCIFLHYFQSDCLIVMRHVGIRLMWVCLTQEAWQYWQQLLEAVDKPAAKKLIKNLDMTNPLGIKHSLSQRKGAKYSKAPLYPFFLETKKRHPTKVLLVRVRVHQS